MQRLSNSISIIVCGIAAYFALHWGSEALAIIASPLHGMDKPSFAHVVQHFARMLGLTQAGVIICAVTFGAAKLGVAILFALYLIRRATRMGDAASDHDLLEFALILVVATIAAMALPFVLTEGASDLNQFRVPLWLVGLAATFTMIERAVASEVQSRSLTWAREAQAIPATLPRQRGRVSAMRWNQLRRDANVDCG
jgi:hypothetical protein